MFKWLQKKKRKTEVSIPQMPEEVSRPEGTLEEVRKQPRNEIPHVLVFPFRLLKKNGMVIPYTASEKEIEPFLNKDMAHFEVGILAMAWKGSKKSFDIMCRELKNKDYYRRKCALEYLIYHDLFEENVHILAEPILDGHEIVVESALKKVIDFHVTGLQEEVRMALACWPDHENIKELCCTILKWYEEEYEDILEKQESKEAIRQRETLVYSGSSQYIIRERMEQPEYSEIYTKLIRTYFPLYAEDRIKAIADGMAKEGCGYATLTTTLTLWFSEREALFRQKFGRNLLQNGKYIMDWLMLDFYCMTDETGHGMNFEQMKERFQKYCYHYGVRVEMEYIPQMSATAYRDYTAKGYILLFAGDFVMYYKKYQPTHVKGLHIMNVSDMQSDGTMTVVSWGRKYTMKSKDIRNHNWYFVYVVYS